MTLGLGLVQLPEETGGILLGASALLVVVGLMDDRFDLSPWIRLLAQISAAALLIGGAGACVTSLGAPFGGPVLLDGPAAYAFTIFIVVAAVNAFNMLDGMDGLAGALAMVALAALAFVAHGSGNIATLAASAVLIGAVAAFLVSNLPLQATQDVRCFMGDSGSTLLGFVVAWLCIALSQGPTAAVSPVTMLWIVAIPLYELFWTVIRRSIKGIPPFRSDQEHLHHRAQQAGIDVLGTFFLFVAVAIGLAATGILLDRAGVSDSASLALLILCGVLFIRLMYAPRLLRRLMPQTFQPVEAPAQD
jgi:UDP-GlcNAc:undecaprenyl-phosphate GlcNAc-1-phosphate transferase